MKNRYKRGAHLKERKFKEVLRMFCADIEAVKVSRLTGVNRNAVNALFARFRGRIAELSEQERLSGAARVQVDEAFFGGPASPVSKRRFPIMHIIALGVIDDVGTVYARQISKVCKSEVVPIICSCCAAGADVVSDGGAVYKALPALWFKHSFVNHSNGEFSRYEGLICVTTNRIEGFWGWTKVRLAKFKGIKYKDFPLHLAESVWRYNNRNRDIYRTLLDHFRNFPL